MSAFKHSVLLFLFAYAVNCFAENKKSSADSLAEIIAAQNRVAPHVDSSEISKVIPSEKGEALLFADPDLHYDTQAGQKKGYLDKLLEWISEKLFGNAGAGNVALARSILLWTFIVLAAITVIWLLWRSEWAGLVKEKPKSITFNFSDITEDLDTIDFEKKISNALLENDLRLAIRWQYLKLLNLLNKKELIRFAPYKTNIDYVNDLKNSKSRDAFIHLSKAYDYVWYGEFVLSKEAYHSYATEFNQFEKMTDV